MPHRSTAHRLAVAAVLAMALSACSLIPPQNIGDVFGLDGRTVPLAAVAAPAALESAQFTSCSDQDLEGTHCAAFESGPFDDPDLPGIATSLIAGLEVDAGLEATLTVGGAAPAQVTVNAFGLSLALSDLSTGDTVRFDAVVTPATPVVFVADGAGSYVATDTSPLGMTLEVAGGDLGTAKDILTGGGRNQASGVVTLDVAEPGIATIDVTLTSDGATVRF